ncbi:hypothetical protein DSO57_1028990 [Entomophthora muscae]|uniref:Uncharacterized protein n=1 Tax=Entomophthora muscae TaxID=34485 RepID=A0ACC2T1K8_9FUNG|nr:hypothetical protein DSO57_1028990 [Entomophthora muscae]
MEPPNTPKPMPVSASELLLDHINKLFGIVYITLTGVINTIIPASGLWSRLVPILWWALATKPEAHGSHKTMGWLPKVGSWTDHPNCVPLKMIHPNCTSGIVATKVQTLPANVSYNTQGALNELPLDISNVMNESGGNVKRRELHPN